MLADLVFATKKAKYKAIVNEVKETSYAKGQPVSSWYYCY